MGRTSRRGGPRWALAGLAVGIAALASIPITFSYLSLIEATQFDATSLLLLAIGLTALLIVVISTPSLLIVAFFLPPVRPTDMSWRSSLALYRRIGALARKAPGPVGARVCAKLSEDALRVAAMLPSHSDAGRAVARAELEGRGAAPAPAPNVLVPSFFGVEDIHSAPRSLEHGRRIKALANAAAWICGVGMAGAGALFYLSRLEVSRVMLIAFGLALVLALLVKSSTQWLRANPMRVLLLRKFNDRRLGQVYLQLIQRKLRHFGHVIALSDKFVRRSMSDWVFSILTPVMNPNIVVLIFMAVRIPATIFLRAMDRTRWGPAFVCSARDYRLLAKRLFSRFELNSDTTQVSEGYLVRTSNDWWQLVVQLMMGSADVIVLDASWVTEGTAWEIKAVTRLALWDRVVRVAIVGREAAARDALSIAPPAPIFFYSESGQILDGDKFDAAMFTALDRSVRARVSYEEQLAPHETVGSV
jgi:hypothetical protein